MFCMSCGRALAANLRFCDGCGADMSGGAVAATPLSQQLKSEVKARSLDAWQGVLIQQGYNPFVAKPVWLCGLMSGEENVFPRQYIGKPLCLVHTSWFTSLSSCRGQKRGIAFLSWGCSGKQPGQNILTPQSRQTVQPAKSL